MKVKSSVLESLHLDPGYALLSVQNILTCLEYFRILDIHYNASINDCQFWTFMKSITDLSKKQAETLFYLLDVDHSGEMDIEEFYLVFCILIACKDRYEKEFIYRHSNSIFKLIDADASGLVSRSEFDQMGVLFNFDAYSISRIFNEFDISGDKNLDFTEFRLFTMACIDEQRSAEALLKVEAYNSYQQRLMRALRRILIKYVRTNVLPVPVKVGRIVNRIKHPYIDERRRWRTWWDPSYFGYSIRRGCGAVKRGFVKCWYWVTYPVKLLFRKSVRLVSKGYQKASFTTAAKQRKERKAKHNLVNYKYYGRNARAGRLRGRSIAAPAKSGTTMAASASATSAKTKASVSKSKSKPEQSVSRVTFGDGKNRPADLNTSEMENE